MKGWKRVVAAVLLCGMLAVGAQGRTLGRIDENWGFEAGSLAGWSVVPDGGRARATRADAYVAPKWGSWMGILGYAPYEVGAHDGAISVFSVSGDKPAGSVVHAAKPLSFMANGLKRTFVAAAPYLKFAYNVCSWYGDPWTAGFSWRIEDEEGRVVAGSAEPRSATASLMQVDDVSSSGWQVVDVDLSRYQGQTLSISLAMSVMVPAGAPADKGMLGHYDWSWAYVDFAPVEPVLPVDALPEVRFVYPVAAGATVRGSLMDVTVEARDDMGVTELRLLVNGVPAAGPTGGSTATFRVVLQEGVNTLRAVVTDTSGKQATAETTIICDSRGPVLTLAGSLPARVGGATVTVVGTVLDPTSGLRSLTISGASVGVDSLGGFSQVVPLRRGANTISVEAIDNVGNVTSQSFAIASGGLATPTSVYVVLTVGKASMDVNSMPVALDAAPFIKDGRTLLPIRALIETLGGTVQWNAQTKTATVALGSRTVALTVGSTKALVNGSPVTLDVAPMIVKGRTFLPLRAVAENLGLDLAWDTATQTISLTYWP